MARFIAGRLFSALCVLFVVSVIVFLIFFKTPGIDPARLMAGPTATPATLEIIKHEYGLERPLPAQYLSLMSRMLISRNLTSFVNPGVRVVSELSQAVPVTASLVLGAVALWIIGGLIIGIISAYTTRPWLDQILSVLTMFALSIPVLWLGTLVAYLSQGPLHGSFLFSWVPAPGYVKLTHSPLGWAEHLILSWIVLSLQYIGIYARLLRASLREVADEDYVRTARAKGLTTRRIVVLHSLRGSLSAVSNVFALDVGALMGGGAIVTEVIFGLPGIGLTLYNAVGQLDMPVIMTITLYGAFVIVLLSLVIDVVNAWLDPRVRLAR